MTREVSSAYDQQNRLIDCYCGNGLADWRAPANINLCKHKFSQINYRVCFTSEGPNVRKPATNQSSTNSGNPKCKHGLPSKMVTVKKEGRNKGRMFYACSNSRYEQCQVSFYNTSSCYQGNSDVLFGREAIHEFSVEQVDTGSGC